MIECKLCRREYDERDCLEYAPPYYGWHPSYGHCFLCFSYKTFGGDMEPDEGVTDWPPYEIKPPAHRHW